MIETGGVEWMRASSGVWHTGGMYGKERIKGFQLWVAMPPALELAEPNSQYLNASDFHLPAQQGSSLANMTASKASSNRRRA